VGDIELGAETFIAMAVEYDDLEVREEDDEGT
jgi:hypothetical protein